VWFRGELSRLAKFDVTSDLTNNAKPYIHVASVSVTEIATLNETSVPYFFNCNLTYLRQDLTVAAGVTIYMGSNRSWQTTNNATIDIGRLLIHGTTEKPVKFTRLPNETYQWAHIVFGLGNSGLNHEIRNCIVEYGGNNGGGFDANIVIRRNCNVTFENVHSSNSMGYGIRIEDNDVTWSGGSTVTFANNALGNVRKYNSSLPPTYYEVLAAMP
jgi:hypothetical protein